MKEDFDTILDKCISGIKSGRADIESCLIKYPQHAAKLKDLLPTVQLLDRATPVACRLEAMSHGRELLLEAVLRKRSSRELAAPRRRRIWQAILSRIRSSQPIVGPHAQTRHRGRPRAIDLRLRWANVLVMLALFFLGGGGVVAASMNSLPGSPLYPVKVATEKAQLALTLSYVSKAKLEVAFAEERVEEIAELVRRGKAEEVAKVAQTPAGRLDNAVRIAQASTTYGEKRELQILLENSAIKQLALLEQTLGGAPEEAKAAIGQALEISGEEYGKAIEALASQASVPLLSARLGTIQLRATDPPPPDVD